KRPLQSRPILRRSCNDSCISQIPETGNKVCIGFQATVMPDTGYRATGSAHRPPRPWVTPPAVKSADYRKYGTTRRRLPVPRVGPLAGVQRLPPGDAGKQIRNKAPGEIEGVTGAPLIDSKLLPAGEVQFGVRQELNEILEAIPLDLGRGPVQHLIRRIQLHLL